MWWVQTTGQPPQRMAPAPYPCSCGDGTDPHKRLLRVVTVSKLHHDLGGRRPTRNEVANPDPAGRQAGSKAQDAKATHLDTRQEWKPTVTGSMTANVETEIGAERDEGSFSQAHSPQSVRTPRVAALGCPVPLPEGSCQTMENDVQTTDMHQDWKAQCANSWQEPLCILPSCDLGH